MSEKRFTYDKPLVAFSKGGINDNVTGETYEFTMDTVLDLLNEQQEKITELEIELTDCKNRKEQLEYKNTKLIAKIDFLERVIDGDV